MEKNAMVTAGKTPSELSGKTSSFIKQGKAFARGEEDTLTRSEDRLATSMESLYNGSGKSDER